MHLSLIGMSGSGKSYWSAKLTERGFRRFCCDDMITDKLAPALSRRDGTGMDLGEWMGFPYEPRYKEREAKYLACEIAVIGEILDYLCGNKPEEKVVVDTTGSVIYAGEDILGRLRSTTLVVHLATPPEIKEKMLQVYADHPRPVLWRDIFSKQQKETNEEALGRCYPFLLSFRERLYGKHAHVAIDYYLRRREGFGVKDLLGEIQAQSRKRRV
jgi:shikimate kinase